MRPTDLPLTRWSPPGRERPTLAVLTGGAPRHERFARRLIEAFGERVAAWYRWTPPAGPVGPAGGAWSRGLAHLRSLAASRGWPATLAGLPPLVRRRLERRRVLRRRDARRIAVEEELFGAEIRRLRRAILREPVDVPDPNAGEFVEQVRSLSPWLLLTLGGPLYRRPLLEAPRGGTINQHAGWSPEYRGTNTIDWALYHRRLDYVGATVHVSATGADSGGILRRSHPCLVADDCPESVFARVVALGTELMIEVVEELTVAGSIAVAPQPASGGRTYLSKDLMPEDLVRTARDFDDGWLAGAIERAARY